MIPSTHVCCVCKSEVVWTDCLPAVCYYCRMREAQKKEQSPQPDAVVSPPAPPPRRRDDWAPFPVLSLQYPLRL